jgi:hypothetical protein
MLTCVNIYVNFTPRTVLVLILNSLSAQILCTTMFREDYKISAHSTSLKYVIEKTVDHPIGRVPIPHRRNLCMI